MNSLNAKEEILQRIDLALASRRAWVEASHPAHSGAAEYLREDANLSREQIIEQFVERVTEYKATVHRVKADSLAKAIEAALNRRGARRLVIPADLDSSWVPSHLLVLSDPGLTNEQLDQSDGVMTTCRLGISQTGTIVLDGGVGQGRRALTLLPDYHLCIIREDQVVGVVPEAVQLLHEDAKRPGHPLTWISGPSATSDIELNRVEGVHGPRTLEVILTS